MLFCGLEVIEMKSKKLGLLLGLIWLVAYASVVQAEGTSSLLIYASTPAYEHSILLDEIDKITFNDNSIEIVLVNTETVSVPYDQFYSAIFSDCTTIEEIPVENELCVRYYSLDATVVVDSSLPLVAVSIYNLQGVVIYSQLSRNKRIEFSLNDYPRGIYVICARNGEKIVSRKLVK